MLYCHLTKSSQLILLFASKIRASFHRSSWFKFVGGARGEFKMASRRTRGACVLPTPRFYFRFSRVLVPQNCCFSAPFQSLGYLATEKVHKSTSEVHKIGADGEISGRQNSRKFPRFRRAIYAVISAHRGLALFSRQCVHLVDLGGFLPKSNVGVGNKMASQRSFPPRVHCCQLDGCVFYSRVLL